MGLVSIFINNEEGPPEEGGDGPRIENTGPAVTVGGITFGTGGTYVTVETLSLLIKLGLVSADKQGLYRLKFDLSWLES